MAEEERWSVKRQRELRRPLMLVALPHSLSTSDTGTDCIRE